MADYKENLDHDQVTLYLDDDTELVCDVVAVFPVDEDEYIALVPADAGEDAEVYLYRFYQNPDDEDDIRLDNIEDDEEFETASEAFYAYMDEVDLDEEEEE